LYKHKHRVLHNFVQVLGRYQKDQHKSVATFKYCDTSILLQPLVTSVVRDDYQQNNQQRRVRKSQMGLRCTCGWEPALTALRHRNLP
jgi:hypothetical protein